MAALQNELRWQILGVVALFIALSGFCFGYFLSSANTLNTPEVHQLSPSKTKTDEVRDVNQLATQFSQRTLAELANASQFGSFYARTEALLEHLAQANIQTVQQLWKQSKKLRTPKFQEEIQQRVVQRWAVLNPIDALGAVQDEVPEDKQNSLIKLIFAEWSLTSIEDAINHAHNLDRELKESAVTGIVLAREDLSSRQRRKIARELDCERVAITVLKYASNDAVIEEPEQEWKLFISENYEKIQNLSDEQFRLLTEIGHSWVLQDGVAVFAEMQDSLPDNFSLVDTARSVADKLINTHPPLALEFVLNGVYQGQETEYHELAIDLITRWAETHPSKALEATHGIKARATRRQMQQRVLEKWATPDPYVLLDTLGSLPDDLHNFAHEIALVELAKHEPETVIGMLGDLPTQRNRYKVAEALVSSWAVIDISSTLQWIDKEPLVAYRKGTLKELAFKMFARNDPQLALETALQQPLKANGEGWEREVIYEVILRDMDTAIAMLPRARPGETRYDTYDFGVIVSLFDSDFAIATELFLNLCEVESKAPKSIDLFARLAPERLFETLGVLRSADARTDAARTFLGHYEGKAVFTVAQIDLLREIERAERKQLPDRISKRLREAYDEVREAIETEPHN